MCKRKKQQHDKFSIIQKTSFCIIAFFMSTTNVIAKGLFDKIRENANSAVSGL